MSLLRLTALLGALSAAACSHVKSVERKAEVAAHVHWVQATELMASERYMDAAQAFLAVAAETQSEEVRAKALNNAAICHENLREFDAATELYARIANEAPSSTLADSARFRVGLNAEKTYDFERALAEYGRLIREFPHSTDREAALFNTARLLHAVGRHGESALAYVQYAADYPQSEDAARCLFWAAVMYEGLHEKAKAIELLNALSQKLSREPASALSVEVKAHLEQLNQ